MSPASRSCPRPVPLPSSCPTALCLRFPASRCSTKYARQVLPKGPDQDNLDRWIGELLCLESVAEAEPLPDSAEWQAQLAVAGVGTGRMPWEGPAWGGPGGWAEGDLASLGRVHFFSARTIEEHS